MRGHILYLERGVSIHFCYDCMVTHPFICSLLSEETRIHSSRMRTARGSSRQLGGGVFQCMLGYIPPGCGPGEPPSFWVWAWRTPLPVWAWRPPPARPLKLPPGCGPGDPPGQTPQAPPSRCGPGDQQGMLAYSPPPHQTYKAYWDTPTPPPVNRITDKCKNIILPQLRCGR